MFDTMTLTKALGGFCGALLVFLLGAWLAEEIYSPSGHGDHQQAFVIEMPDADGDTEVEAEEAPDFAEFLAMADPAAGQTLYVRACQACHSLEQGVNGTGPYLYGIVGREIQAVANFGYSGALEGAADIWDHDSLNEFIANPNGFARGTSMGYNGMRSIQDRANLIAFLDSLDD